MPWKLCVRNLLIIIFLNYFLICNTNCLDTITIPYALFTNYFLISFNHSLSNLKHLIFLTFCPTNICKSIFLSFTFDGRNSFFSLSLCFKVHLFLFVFPLSQSLGFCSTLLSTWLFNHHVSLCLAGFYIHPQVWFSDLSKAFFKIFK